MSDISRLPYLADCVSKAEYRVACARTELDEARDRLRKYEDDRMAAFKAYLKVDKAEREQTGE